VLVTDSRLSPEARGILAEHIDQLIVAPDGSRGRQGGGSPTAETGTA
jgi:hypothetical protein